MHAKISSAIDSTGPGVPIHQNTHCIAYKIILILPHSVQDILIQNIPLKLVSNANLAKPRPFRKKSSCQMLTKVWLARNMALCWCMQPKMSTSLRSITCINICYSYCVTGPCTSVHEPHDEVLTWRCFLHRWRCWGKSIRWTINAEP